MSYSDGNTPAVGDKVRRQKDSKVGTVTHVQLNYPTTPGHDNIGFKPDDGSIGVGNSLAVEYILISRAETSGPENLGDARKPDYRVTADNKVVGPEGLIYDEGDKAVAEQLAAFLNSKGEFEQALEDVLDKHDYPLSGTEWRDMLRRIAIKGEQG